MALVYMHIEQVSELCLLNANVLGNWFFDDCNILFYEL